MMFKQCIAPKDTLFNEILVLLDKANQILREQYQQYLLHSDTFNIQQKEDQSAVTQADFSVHSYFSTALQNLTQKYPVLSEEGKHNERHAWDTFWLLDPLDGTKEFLAKRPEFTINLSLVQHGKTELGIISVPQENCLYIGYAGKKPFKYQFSDHTWWVYEKSDICLADQVLRIGMSHQSDSKQMQYFLQQLEKISPLQIIHAGSAYKFCLMLEGLIDIYPRFHPTCEWDTSAGQCLLEGIGGGLWSHTQTPFMYNQRKTLLNGNFIAFTHMQYAKYAFQCL